MDIKYLTTTKNGRMVHLQLVNAAAINYLFWFHSVLWIMQLWKSRGGKYLSRLPRS